RQLRAYPGPAGAGPLTPHQSPPMSDSDDLRARVQALLPRFPSPLDFGNGLVTRPWHVQRRFRRRLRLLQIPDDLSGKTVLDIGAWDGYFSFEFERRGAHVLAIDTYAWDHGAFDCFLLARDHFRSNDHDRNLAR